MYPLIGEGQLPLANKCYFNPLLDAAINPSVIGEYQLQLGTKCHHKPSCDVAINKNKNKNKKDLFTVAYR